MVRGHLGTFFRVWGNILKLVIRWLNLSLDDRGSGVPWGFCGLSLGLFGGSRVLIGKHWFYEQEGRSLY